MAIDELRTERLLPNSVLDQMWTPGKLADGSVVGGKGSGYGFGWNIPDLPGHRFIEHDGAWQGFTTYIGRLLDTGETVVVLTNLDAGHSHPTRIAHAIFALSVPKLAP